MKFVPPVPIHRACLAAALLLGPFPPTFGQDEVEPEFVALPPPPWTRDIQIFEKKLRGLAKEAEVPTVKELDEAEETEAITDGYGGYVDFDARKGTLQHVANELVKRTIVEWEFQLLEDPMKTGDEVGLIPSFEAKEDGEDRLARQLHLILVKDPAAAAFKAGDRIKLKATIDDFSRFRKDFDLATGLIAIYHLEGAKTMFWLKLADDKVARVPPDE